MTTNRYFNQHNSIKEQNLVESLVTESIQIFGRDVYYLPRTLQKEDLIYGEDTISKFSNYFTIEMYLKSVEGFAGQGDMFRKFGLEIDDQATLVVSQKRFQEEVVDIYDPIRPKEGDLIFFPWNNSLCEIKFVNNESIFYQLGKVYVWELTIRQYVFSHEDIKVGVSEIDTEVEGVEYQITIDAGAGTGTFVKDEFAYQGTNFATATAKGRIVSITGTNDKIQITNIVGVFDPLIVVKGSVSLASYAITSIDPLNILKDASASNETIQTETSTVIDFSENNPFSEEVP
jgi:Virus neck protein